MKTKILTITILNALLIMGSSAYAGTTTSTPISTETPANVSVCDDTPLVELVSNGVDNSIDSTEVSQGDSVESDVKEKEVVEDAGYSNDKGIYLATDGLHYSDGSPAYAGVMTYKFIDDLGTVLGQYTGEWDGTRGVSYLEGNQLYNGWYYQGLDDGCAVILLDTQGKGVAGVDRQNGSDTADVSSVLPLIFGTVSSLGLVAFKKRK